MSKATIKDIAVRMVKTFIQGFLGALIVVIPSSTDFELWKTALIGACAGGISAVMNLVLNMMNKESEETK